MKNSLHANKRNIYYVCACVCVLQLFSLLLILLLLFFYCCWRRQIALLIRTIIHICHLFGSFWITNRQYLQLKRSDCVPYQCCVLIHFTHISGGDDGSMWEENKRFEIHFGLMWIEFIRIFVFTLNSNISCSLDGIHKIKDS